MYLQGMSRSPEATYIVSLNGETIQVENPDRSNQTMSLSGLRRVLVETNDSGPWGLDVWWVIEGQAEVLRFPLGATGEDAFLTYAKRLPGFEIGGMNSTSNAQFECWPNPK